MWPFNKIKHLNTYKCTWFDHRLKSHGTATVRALSFKDATFILEEKWFKYRPDDSLTDITIECVK